MAKGKSGAHDGGDVMKGGAGMAPRKAIAGAVGHEVHEGGENFGVQSFEHAQNHMGHHPDHVAMTGAKEPLEDHERGVGHPIHHTRHHHPAQASPHHGPHHPDGYGHHQHEEHPEHHPHRGG
jgi:hypothetical protein